VDRYGETPLVQVGDEIVADWLAGGKRAGSVQGLCSMFNDAASVKAGRLIDRNPFQKLGISRGKGRRDQQPPSEPHVWQMIAHARTFACPSFAAWLQVAAFTGMRPGELDALRWERVDFDRHRIIVAEQFNAATRTFDTPKNHLRREAPLTAHARQALRGLSRESEFCFVSPRGEHWTPSSRAYQDGGNLVRRLYGHRDKGRALDRIVGAYATRAENRPQRAGSSKGAPSQQSLFGDTYV
jgi:integrase